MDAMNKLKDMVCLELEEISKKGKLTAQDLDIVNKLVVTKEKMLRTEQIEEEMGYSHDGGWTAHGNYSRAGYPRTAYPMGAYPMRAEGYAMDPYEQSMRSGRNYSMNDGRNMMWDRLSEIMNDPNLNQQERATIKKAMESIR